jgi:hypothetical protein
LQSIAKWEVIVNGKVWKKGEILEGINTSAKMDREV